MYKIIFLLMVTLCFVYAEEVSEENTINDEDKTSSRINNMFTDMETVEKAANAIKTGVKVVKEAKKVKNLEDVKKVSVSKLKGKAKDLVFKYKNAKAGFLKGLFDFANKVSKMLDGVNRKLNKWDTTLPTIKAYGKSMRKMLDNTVEVFHEFEWKDLYDIDRKWDRKMEGQLIADYNTFMNFSRFLDHRYYTANNEDSKEIASYFGQLFNFDNEVSDTDTYYIDAASSANEHRLITYYTLYNCAEAISMTSQMMNKIHTLNSDGVSKESQTISDIEKVIQNGKRTMEDERQLHAMIERSRHEVNVQSTELEQLIASLQEKYGRIYLRKAEVKAMESEDYYKTIEKFMNCTSKDFGSIDDYRKKIMN